MKNKLIYIGVAAVVVLLACLLFVQPNKKIDARITLDKKDKIPYGTNVAYKSLSYLFPSSKILTNAAEPKNWKTVQKKDSGQVLIIVNSFFNPTEKDLDLLTVFAQKGNFVFISALQMNEISCKFFKVQENNYFDADDYNISGNEVSLRQFDSLVVKLDSTTFSGNLSYSYPGIGYDNHFYRMDSVISYPLGTNASKKVNFMAMNTGKGTIFVHSAPIAFTNLFLLYHQNHQYLQKMFSVLPANPKKVVWDEYFLNKKVETYGEDKKGILSVLFRYPNFQWAFWVAMAVLLLYVLTEVKRRQRIIPPYKKPENDSLEFVTTVGKLYYEKGDHKNLADKLTLFFLDYIRNKYKIDTRYLNKPFAEAVAVKTNIPTDEMIELVETIQSIQLAYKISSQQLIAYYNLLENFYKKA